MLEGKHAVITGGGRGIGASVAESLARNGAAVTVTARSTDEIESVASALREAGHRAVAATCDVTDPTSVHAMAEAARRAHGPVDILVNNAGIGHSSALGKIDLESWNRVLAVNVTGTMLCCQTFAPDMVERGWGRVVNIASIASLRGGRYITTYSASKHAVLGLTRSLADELGGHGITVNAVCPGFVDTEMTRESVARIVAKTGRSAEEALQAILQSSYQNRLIDPAEVAFAVLSLCDHDARGINGQPLVIDGGGPPS